MNVVRKWSLVSMFITMEIADLLVRIRHSASWRMRDDLSVISSAMDIVKYLKNGANGRIKINWSVVIDEFGVICLLVFIERAITSDVLEHVQPGRVVVIYGGRRVGKTTLLEKLRETIGGTQMLVS